MKKITVILVSVVYVSAIIVVAFLGVLAETRNATVEVTKIVLDQTRDLASGGILTYPTGTRVEDSIYAIYSRPDGEGEASSDIAWTIDGIRFDYVIQVRGYATIYERGDWKDGKGCFDLGAFVLPENATEQRLIYQLSDSNGDQPSFASINEEGLISFSEAVTGITAFQASISATDNSGIVCNVRFIMVGY